MPRPEHRTPVSGRTVRRAFLAAFLVVGSATCARPGQPVGGPPDLLPPQVVEVFPEPGTIMDDSVFTVRLRFNEKISERTMGGAFERAVVVSPEIPDLEIRHNAYGIEIRPPNGEWPFRHAYRVTVQPIVQDLFNNAMAEPFEFSFGSGSFIPDGAVAGVVTDRITGLPVQDVRIDARRTNSAPSVEEPFHVARTDSAGIFIMRNLPRGVFSVRAWSDVDNDREPDPFEAIGAGDVSMGLRDTIFLDLEILTPDTTAAILASAEVVDSATVRLEFDDFVDQEVALDGVTVALTDSLGRTASAFRLLHQNEYREELRLREIAARAAADTTGPPQGPPPEPPTGEADTGPPIRPVREFFAVLPDSLRFEMPYAVRVGGVRNLNGLPGGGGTDTVVRPTPPPPDTTPTADSTAVRPDTGAVDTFRVLRRRG